MQNRLRSRVTLIHGVPLQVFATPSKRCETPVGKEGLRIII